MLSKEQFEEVDLNHMFEVGTLLDGLTKEKVVWICQERCQHPSRGTEVAVFGLYYFDVEIGRMRGELMKSGRIDWKEVA